MTVFRLREDGPVSFGALRAHVRVYDHLGADMPVVIVGKPTNVMGSITNTVEDIASAIQREFFSSTQRWTYVEHHPTEIRDSASWPTFQHVQLKRLEACSLGPGSRG